MIDSGSVVSLITKTLAKRILITSQSANWTTTKQDRDLKIFFSNEPIKVLGKFITTVTYNDCNCKEATLTNVEDGHKLIIGRELLTALAWQWSNNSQQVVKVLTILIIQHVNLRRQISKDSCSEIKISSKIYSKAPKMSTRSN